MDARYDALIIGGGPAGALSALLLTRQGWRVAVVERRVPHESKTCGHCLDGRANALLERVGLLSEVQSIAAGIARDAMIYMPGTIPLRWPMGHGSGEGSMLVQRSRLDQLLLDQARSAGAHVVQPATASVRHVEPGRCVVRINGQIIEGSMLIGADGLRSRVALATELGDTAAVVGRKYGFAFDLPTERGVNLEAGVTHMFVASGGYLGIVHEAGGSLHIAALVDGRGRRSPTVFIERMRDTFPQLARLDLHVRERFNAVGPMPIRPASVANERAALVGDAAGYVEPFTGEGMTWALQSAELLSQVAHRITPGNWTAAAAAVYCRLWRRVIAPRQRYCRVLAWILERPGIVRPLMALAHYRPRIIGRIAQQVLAV